MTRPRKDAINRAVRGGAFGDEPPMLGLINYPGEETSDDPIGGPQFGKLPSLTVRMALAEVLEDWDSRARRNEQRAERRVTTTHLSRDVGNLYELNEFEQSLRREIDHIAWICLQPLDDLRYEEVVQPVGRVRRPARGAAQQLAAHSEQWERWAPEFPIPREVLAAIRDDDVDLYENRATRTLVVGSILHLNRRLQQLRSQLLKNTQGRLVLLSGWYWRQERLKSAFDTSDIDFTIEMLRDTVDQLEAMVSRLTVLRSSSLFASTPSNVRIRNLRITNVLRRDGRYRRIPPLWDLWSRTQDQADDDLKRLDNPTLALRGMDVLVEVLATKAIRWLGYSFDGDEDLYRNGPSSIKIENDDGATYLLIDDFAGQREVRLVPLASPLIDPSNADPLRAAREFHRWAAGHSGQISRTAFIHPVDADLLDTVEPHDRALVDHTGFDAPDSTLNYAVIPASPLLIDSIERVTRFVRWHLVSPLYTSYPARIDFGDSDRGDRDLIEAVSCAHLDGRTLVIMEPIGECEQQLTSRSNRRPATWPDDLERVSGFFDLLLRCPVFPTHGRRHTILESRDNGTFTCECRNCNARWGADICGNCGSLLPFIRPGVSVPDGEHPSAFFGGDLLSSLCEGAKAGDVAPVGGGPDRRTLICPRCRVCARSAQYPSCSRCSSHANPSS